MPSCTTCSTRSCSWPCPARIRSPDGAGSGWPNWPRSRGSRAGGGLEQTLLGPYLRPDFVPRIGFVASDWIAKQGLVAAGLGVTLVPALAAGALRADLAVCALDADEVPVRTVHAATRRGVAPSAATAAFLGQLRAAAQALSAELAALV
ncbi:LysR substrate-binding domain-containing protein [Yinghuangia aomiensis]